MRDVKRLYLSGVFLSLAGRGRAGANTDWAYAGNPNPFPLTAPAQACYNLVYLELAACRLTTLPAGLAALIPNVRVLNLNYNFLGSEEVVRGLAGLSRLRKLTIVGGRMRGTKGVIRMLRGMADIEMLDFRYVFSFGGGICDGSRACGGGEGGELSDR